MKARQRLAALVTFQLLEIGTEMDSKKRESFATGCPFWTRALEVLKASNRLPSGFLAISRLPVIGMETVRMKWGCSAMGSSS